MSPMDDAKDWRSFVKGQIYLVPFFSLIGIVYVQ